MKLVCLHIPRKTVTEADAIYETTWDLTNVRLFLHLLDELQESIHEPFSLEFYSKDNIIHVCVAADESIADVLVAGLYALIPNTEIHDIEDYTSLLANESEVVSSEIRLTKSEIYPLQSYKEFACDSTAPLFPVMSSLPPGHRMLTQLVIQPVRDNARLHFSLWSKRCEARMKDLITPRAWFKRDLTVEAMKKVAIKCNLKLYHSNYRVAAWCENPGEDRRTVQKQLEQHVHSLTTAIKMFNTVNENQIKSGRFEYGLKPFRKFQARYLGNAYKLATNEVATIWHPPTLGTLPNTVQVLSKKGTPPRNLPSDVKDDQVSFFGVTNYRNTSLDFGIRRFDRRRHFYIVGKSGAGKSCMLQLLVKNDIDKGFGCAVLDPHGDLVDDLLKMIPKHRVKDVVLFDPSDTQYPPSFNPMNAVRPELKMRVTIGFLDIFKKVFKADWTDRMDHVLRYSMMVLLDVPGASLLSLRKLLTDDTYRMLLVKSCRDESVRRFWEHEFAHQRREYEEGTISRILNRLDELLATDMLRNILGQPLNLFNFREFMDSRKIVLMKVSKGVLGAENASLLGSLVIAKIYEAAMSRADMPPESRQDFYFYIDEFQNFATDSFGEILSESRKYRLCLTFANQFLGQLPANVRQTVFGNVGNVLGFRVGGDDAPILEQEFRPRFGQEDVLNLGIRDFYLKMCVDGEVQEAFSGRTIEVEYPPTGEQFVKECIQNSRQRYAIPRAQAVETVNVSEHAGTPTAGQTAAVS